MIYMLYMVEKVEGWNSDGWQNASVTTSAYASCISTYTMPRLYVFVAGGSVLQTTSAEGSP